MATAAQSAPMPAADARTSVNGAWYVIALLSAIGVVSYLDRLALNLLVDPIRADLGISDTEMGLLIGPSFAVLFAVAALPAAWAVDRGNRKLLLAGGVMLWSATTIGSAFARDFETLLLCRAGVGIGEAVLSPVALSMIGDLFARPRRPTPAGIFISSQTLGAALSFVVVAAILDFSARHAHFLPAFIKDEAPWRIALFVVGCPGIVLAVLLLVSTREPERGRFDLAAGEERRPEKADAAMAAFTSPRQAARFYIPFLLAANFATMLSYVAMSWYPTYLIRFHRMEASTVGYLFGAFTLIGGVAGTLLYPIISERLARGGERDSLMRLILWGLPVSLGLFLIAMMAPGIAVAIVAVGAFKGFNNGIASSASVVIATIGGAATRGRLTAFHLIIQCILTSIGPVAVAILSDRVYGGQMGKAMIAIALVALPLSFLLMMVARLPYRAAVSR